MHVEMARAAGKTAEADLWETYADRLEAAISKVTDAEGRWDASRFGYYRDPVTTFCSDYYGFDVASFMPAEWLARSKNTFVYDMTRLDSSLHGTHFGIAIGYDHNMACQNALLFDEMGEATQFLENLTRAHYAPRLPGVYTTPESISVDVKRGIVRRQGDLGNLVQMSESIKTLFMTAGVSPLRTDTLTLIPRLPKSWNVDVADYTIPYSTTKLDFHADYPDENGQTASFTIDNTSQVKKLRFRAGPFPEETTVANAVVNKNIVPLTLFSSGDSKWAWLELDAPSANTKYNVQIYLTDDIPQQTFTVTFMDRDSQIAKVENVSEGQTVSLPEEPGARPRLHLPRLVHRRRRHGQRIY